MRQHKRKNANLKPMGCSRPQIDVANNCKSIKWLCRLVTVYAGKISRNTRMHSMIKRVAYRFKPIVDWHCSGRLCSLFSPFSKSFHFIDHRYQIQISLYVSLKLISLWWVIMKCNVICGHRSTLSNNNNDADRFVLLWYFHSLPQKLSPSWSRFKFIVLFTLTPAQDSEMNKRKKLGKTYKSEKVNMKMCLAVSSRKTCFIMSSTGTNDKEKLVQ